MDLPVPPAIVLERPAPCPDAGKAQELLERALAPSNAPGPGWTVRVRFEREGRRLHAEGEISDGAAAPVAHRELEEGSLECSALARAMGVWASLVLDDELERSKQLAPPAPPPPAPPAAAESHGWPAPAPPEKPYPEAALFLKHPETERTIELGLTSFLMGGTGSGVVAGPSLFGVLEAGRGWFLRPAIAVGRSIESLTPTSDVYATWGTTRFDACGRMPGFYLERRGMQFDICGGGELGFVHFDSPSTPPSTSGAPPQPVSGRTIPVFAVGPSFGLRGELGSDLSALVRGVAEVNVIRESFSDGAGTNVDPSLFVGRVEVGLSWRLR